MSDIRLAAKEDLPQIVAIYNSSIAGRLATADTEEVSVEAKREWFRRHSDVRPLLICEHDGSISGWLSFESFYGRPAYRATVELSLYVSPQFQRRGIARSLLTEALRIAPDIAVENLTAFIFSHNEPSRRLFRSFGFECWGELPGIAEMDGNKYSLSILGLKLTPSEA